MSKSKVTVATPNMIAAGKAAKKQWVKAAIAVPAITCDEAWLARLNPDVALSVRMATNWDTWLNRIRLFKVNDAIPPKNWHRMKAQPAKWLDYIATQTNFKIGRVIVSLGLLNDSGASVKAAAVLAKGQFKEGETPDAGSDKVRSKKEHLACRAADVAWTTLQAKALGKAPKRKGNREEHTQETPADAAAERGASLAKDSASVCQWFKAERERIDSYVRANAKHSFMEQRDLVAQVLKLLSQLSVLDPKSNPIVGHGAQVPPKQSDLDKRLDSKRPGKAAASAMAAEQRNRELVREHRATRYQAKMARRAAKRRAA